MAISRSGDPRPLRLWPGVLIAVLALLGRFVVPSFIPEAFPYGLMGAVLGGLAIVLWWLFFSRAPWIERLGAIALMAGGLFLTSRFVHPSIANGMMGRMLPVFGSPVLALALVVWAVASRRLADGPRRASMVLAILMACGLLTAVRTGGISGGGDIDLHWRWSQTPEERLLSVPAEPVAAAPAPATVEKAVAIAPAPAPPKPAPERSEVKAPGEPTAVAADRAVTNDGSEWPGFRGPLRDGVIRGVTIKTDWSASPPVEIWRRPIGPGWSSFAVHGDLVYTQEQRGEEEVVSCYNLDTGMPVWRHQDRARFWESNGGAGPRGTPTLSQGRVHTLGGTGIVNVLDARDGSLVWSRNAATDTGAKLPGWGFAGSPLIVDDLVVVAASGRLVAYDAAKGEARWFGPKVGGGGYSSPHLLTIDGVTQILLVRGGGVVAVAPNDGAVLWEHLWEAGVSITQPAQAPNGDILFAAGDAMGGWGLRRLTVANGPSGWTVVDRWSSRGLKPYFSDFVLHKGHAFGFDGSIMSSIDLADGARKWKGGRYGSGQLVLLADQDLLLVSGEEGGLALVAALPDQFTEIARFKAVAGKTWNHPVLAGGILLVRNAEEMVAFRMPLASN